MREPMPDFSKIDTTVHDAIARWSAQLPIHLQTMPPFARVVYGEEEQRRAVFARVVFAEIWRGLAIWIEIRTWVFLGSSARWDGCPVPGLLRRTINRKWWRMAANGQRKWWPTAAGHQVSACAKAAGASNAEPWAMAAAGLIRRLRSAARGVSDPFVGLDQGALLRLARHRPRAASTMLRVAKSSTSARAAAASTPGVDHRTREVGKGLAPHLFVGCDFRRRRKSRPGSTGLQQWPASLVNGF
jgi:hypothetical protein